MTSKLKTVMSSLNLGSKSDYQKIRAIYDYITSHVKYDNNHDNYPVEYTAYGALVKGKAACQGIASLFYRMALEAGLDARIIPGDSTGDGITDHAWNIVRLDGKYYNVDATWDLGNKPANYEYFLKCQKSFPFHYRESDYKTAAFNKKYPMATSDYRNLFDDVKDSSHPYFAAIYWAAGKGITNGYTGTNTFGINDACTRSQAMMFLWKMAGKPAPKAGVKNPFTDLKSSHPHYRAIMWSYSYGIAKGFPNHTYGVDVACTRGQIMTFIWRYAGQPSPKSTKNPFKDKLTPAYRTAILWGSEKGITKGSSDGTFKDSVICTRGQIVTFLYRIRSWGYKAA